MEYNVFVLHVILILRPLQSLELRPLPFFVTKPEASISTSVPLGRDLTLMQVRT